MTNQTYKTPLFKELSDDELRVEYRGWRDLAYNNVQMAASGAVNIKKMCGANGSYHAEC